jgi:hypothetical protein
MEHRVRLARTAEQDSRETVEPMIGELEARVLAGYDEPRRLAKLGKSVGDRA